MFQENPGSSEDQYLLNYRKAKKNDLVLMILVTMEGCPPCNGLKEVIKNLDPKKVIVTIIDRNNPHVSELNKYYAKKGGLPISRFPDWVLIKYENNSPKNIKRYLGYCSIDELNKRIDELK